MNNVKMWKCESSQQPVANKEPRWSEKGGQKKLLGKGGQKNGSRG
jgi:hypothetical protein